MTFYFVTNFAFSPLFCNNMKRPRSPPHPLPSHVLPQSGMSHSACSQQAANCISSFLAVCLLKRLWALTEQRQMSMVSWNDQSDSKANKILGDHWCGVFAALFVLAVCGLDFGIKWFSRWQGRWMEEGCHHYRLYCRASLVVSETFLWQNKRHQYIWQILWNAVEEGRHRSYCRASWAER